MSEPPPEGEPRPRRRPLRASWRRSRSLRRRMIATLRHNTGLKLVALLLACFLWYSINELERDAERLVDLPVAIRRVPSGLIVTDLTPAKGVTVTLRGPRTILDNVDEQKTRLVVDLSNAAAPGKVSIDLNRASLNPELPRRLKAVRMSPARLEARLEELAKRRLPVTAALAGDPAVGYTAKATVTPDHVEVTGPSSTVATLKDVDTRRIDIDGLTAPFERNILIDPAGDFVSIVPDRVRVSVHFEEAIATQDFKRVPIALRNGEGAKVTPAEVSVSVSGPVREMQSWLAPHDGKMPDGAVFIDAGGLAPGAHDLPVQVDLPAPLEVKARRPESVRVVVPAPKAEGGA